MNYSTEDNNIMGQLINRRRVLGGKAQYLTFTALESGTFTFTIPAAVTASYLTSVSYSTNYGVTWVTTNNSSSDVTITTPTISAGDTVMWKGVGNQASVSNDNPTGISRFSSTGTFRASGNVMSMLYGDNFLDKTSFQNGSTYNLSHLFSECSTLMSIVGLQLPATTLTSHCYSYMFEVTPITFAPSNLLPATTLAECCYQGMFSTCSSLIAVPDLPVTTLAKGCYQYMFNACTSLTNAPILPATTLANNCYQNMFYYCISLTSAPQLPATTLVNECYRSMFNSCTSLTVAPSIPATTVASSSCYSMFYGCTNLTTAPSTLSATTLAENCYRSMFYNCENLTTVPTVSATTLATYCCAYMFKGCSKITSAPVLSATTLVSNCYHQMFYGCSKLNYIKAMFTTKPTTSYTSNWVNGVASSGTFVKNSSATWSVTGVSGVPSGWTVQTASS